MEVSGQLYDPAALLPGPIVQEAVWAPELIWTLWKKEESLALVRNRTPDSAVVQAVVYSLYRLSYPAFFKFHRFHK
jgi:hypothetical protein